MVITSLSAGPPFGNHAVPSSDGSRRPLHLAVRLKLIVEVVDIAEDCGYSVLVH